MCFKRPRRQIWTCRPGRKACKASERGGRGSERGNAACVNRRKVIPERERKMYGDIIILSGAGISAESGIPTFRDSDGLWNNHRIEEVATIEAYRRNPEAVHDFYNNLKTDLQKAEPNPAHLAITRLQNEYKNGTVSVVTQNVDLLHEKAGDAFAPRNKYALEIDDEIDPPMFKISDTHFAATWLLDPRAPKVEMPPELKDRVARMSAEAKKIEEAE